MDSKQSPGVKKNQSLGKALLILEKMVELRSPVKLKELSAALDLPSSTVLRFLTTLQDFEYVGQNPETSNYFLTLKISRLGEEVQSRFEIRDLVRPELNYLSRTFNESVSLAVRQSDTVVYLDGVEGPGHTLRTLKRIGHQAPLHCTGVGKLLLLDDTPEELAALFARTGFAAPTEYSITSLDLILKELSKIRGKGYALDDQECEYGVKCIAVPLRDYTGHVVAAVSLTAPLPRMGQERIQEIIPVLNISAERLSGQLGYTGKTS